MYVYLTEGKGGSLILRYRSIIDSMLLPEVRYC